MLLSSRVLPLFFPPAAFQYFVFSFTLCSWQPLSGRSLSAATAALGHGLCSSGFLSGWSLLLASAGPVAAAASPSLCSGCSSLRCPWGLPCCWSPSASSAGARCASFSPPPIIAAARQLMNCPARPAVHGTGRDEAGGRAAAPPAWAAALPAAGAPRQLPAPCRCESAGAQTRAAARGRSASDPRHERGPGGLEKRGQEPGDSPKMGNQLGRAEEHDQGLYGRCGMPGLPPAACRAGPAGEGARSRGCNAVSHGAETRAVSRANVMPSSRLEKWLLCTLCRVNGFCFCSVPESAAPSSRKLWQKSCAGWNTMPTREGP